MCTAILDGCFFGRTLDVECEWGGEVYRGENIIGMARVEGGVPLFFDAVNSSGLAAAALNFPALAHYRAESGRKFNIPSYNLITFVLEKCKSACDAEALLADVNVTPEAFAPSLPPTPLHWMFADRGGSIVFEQTSEGGKVYRNPIGVMTNAPTFPEHLKNLENGIRPTDLSSESRFILAAEAKKNAARGGVEGFFGIMESVFVELGRGAKKETRTVYTSCIDLDRGEYYCKSAGKIKFAGFVDKLK